MKLYTSKINTIAEEMINTLRNEEAIDVSDQLSPEAILDVQGVLREYIRTDRKLTNKARELSESGRGSFSRIKRQLSMRNNFKVGDEGIDYIVDQLIETFLHSHHIEEIYADDRALRLTISTIIKKHTRDMEGELDEKVRSRIKNLSEDSLSWDSEYDRVMSQLKREKSLD